MPSPAAPFAVTFAPELTPPQWIVERGAMRIVPTVDPPGSVLYTNDPDAAKRAAEVCEVLNRVYAGEAAP